MEKEGKLISMRSRFKIDFMYWDPKIKTETSKSKQEYHKSKADYD